MYAKSPKNTAGNQPIQEAVMGAVEPWPLIVHLGIVMGVEDIIEVFLSPAQQWLLYRAFQSHRPDI